MKNYITAFFGSSLVNKSFVREGGLLVKAEKQSSFFTGTAIKLECESLGDLHKILKDNENNRNFCLSLGFHEQAACNKPYRVVKKNDLSVEKLNELGIDTSDYRDGDDYVDNEGVYTTARLKAKMKQSHFTLFDYDSKGNDLTINDWVDAVSEIVPQFKLCGKLITASNSARVGYELSNFHVYTKLNRTNGLTEFGKNLGSHLEGKLDTSTFSRERVIYEGCPLIEGEITPAANIRIEGDGSDFEITSIIPKEGSRKDQHDKGLSSIVLDDTGINIFEKIKLDDRNYASLFDMKDEINQLDEDHTNGNSSSDSNIRCWVTHLRPESKSRNGKIWNHQGLPIIRDYNDQGVPVNYTLGEDDELSKLIWWFDKTGAAQYFFNEIQEINYKNRLILDKAEAVALGQIPPEDEPVSQISTEVDYEKNDKLLHDVNDCFIPIRIEGGTFHVPIEINKNEHAILDRLSNLGANYDVCRVIINRVYKYGSKFYTINEAGGFIEQNKDSLVGVICQLYGIFIEEYDASDKADKERFSAIMNHLVSYINAFNQYGSDELGVDMFCDYFKLTLKTDDVANSSMLANYPYRPAKIPYLMNIDSYESIINDYKTHYPDVEKILDFIVHSRFAPNTRTSMMWFKAQSGWGKSLLFENLEELGLMFRFQNNDEFLNVISGSPFGINKGGFVTSLGFFVDEFDRVTKALKSIDSKININPKHDRPFSLTTYSKIFISHQDIAGLSGGVDTELGNRFVYEEPKNMGLITKRELFNKNRGEYKNALSHWLAITMNKKVSVLVEKGRVDAESYATDKLSAYFEENSLKDKLGSLDEDIVEVADEIRYSLERMWEYRLNLESSIQVAPDDKVLIEMFHTNVIMSSPISEEYKGFICMKSLDKFLLTYLHHNFKHDKGMFLALKRRKHELKELLTKEFTVSKSVRFQNGKRHRVSLIKMTEKEEL